VLRKREAETEEMRRREEREAAERRQKEEREDEIRRQATEEKRQREERQNEIRRQEAIERRQTEEREEERRRQEADERMRKSLLEAEQVELRRRESERQTARDKAEDERQDSAVAKGKPFGDAMRASDIRMGADPIELISFFRNCEQLFAACDVPASLQAILIRPFLNDRARTYLIKLDHQVSGDYTQSKDVLL